MANIRVPFLVERAPKHGASSWYWQPSAALARAGWKPLALGKNFAAALKAAQARNAEVAQWQHGGARPVEIKRRVERATVAALVERYRREVLHGTAPTGGARIKPRTAEAYETGLKRIEAWAGQHPLDFVTPARVRALRDATVRPPDPSTGSGGGIGHSAAFNLLKTGRQLFAFAESVDLRARGSNPFTAFDLGAPPPRSQVWEAEDDAAFDAAAYALGMPGLALAREVALYTAQREGDLIAFTEAEFAPLDVLNPLLVERLAGSDGRVMGWRNVQAKGQTAYEATQLEIPFEPVLRAKVEAALRANRARDRAASPPRLLTHVLIDDRTGLPWSKRAFIRAWRAVLEHAATATGRESMRDLVWHDLRRTRVVRLRRRGMAKEMIAAITGHKPKSLDMMLKVYGPIDPTITAAAIVAALDQLPAKQEPSIEAHAKPSNSP